MSKAIIIICLAIVLVIGAGLVYMSVADIPAPAKPVERQVDLAPQS